MKVLETPQDYPDFLHDSSNFKGTCSRIYLPENHDDIAEAVALCREAGESITVSGGGTGLTGGRVPQGGVVLSFSRINRAPEFNHDNTLVTVDAGLPLSELLSAVQAKGMFFPPDPTEKSCFCGGITATNASGAKSFYFGPVRNFVQGLQVTLPSGAVIDLKRGECIADGKIFTNFPGLNRDVIINPLPVPNVKNASGYYLRENMDALDLFIGSEGTLGIIQKVTFKLIAKPQYIISCLIHFTEEKQALDFIYMSRGGIGRFKPRALEYFDGGALRLLAADYPFIKRDAAAAVWLEIEMQSREAETAAGALLDILGRYNAEDDVVLAADEGKRKQLEAMRHSAAYKVNEYIARKGLRKLGTDTAVPHEVFGEFYDFCKNSVRKAGLNYVIYGHFGDSHIHLNMLPEGEAEFEKGRAVYGEICQKAVELGGTVSAEHGIGKIKRDYLKMMFGEGGIVQMRQVKRQFDPGFMLGRGNLFAPD